MLEEIKIENMIYEIRGKQVMLDSDLAKLYGVGIRVFIEQGVAMLATILKCKVVTQVSIRIMNAFVSMRKFINENKDIFKRLMVAEYKLLEHDDKIEDK